MPLRALRQLWNPYFRYRHAKLIHAMRVGFAILVSMLLTTAIGLPYGEWTSITVLVVMGGLQHQGNIRRKAIERGIGTMIGASAGLTLILQQNIFGTWAATEALIAASCGVCAYYAVGKAGYIALLSAITIVVVAGHGDNSLAAGLWRTVDIVIGIAIALLFSFALPLYATWTWRYRLADSLRGLATLYAGIAGGGAFSADEEIKMLAAQSATLVELRSLMPWVAKEAHIEAAKMEEIQRSLRLCISTLELMAGARRRPGADNRPAASRSASGRADRQTIALLIRMARALKLGKGHWLRADKPADLTAPVAPDLAPDLAPDMGEYALLTSHFRDEIQHLTQLLSDTESQWNI